MQAIKTKYISATDYKGTRIKAECDALTIIVSWNDSLDTEANHVAAAHELCARMFAKNEKLYGPGSGATWKKRFVTGGLKNDGYAHVFIS